MKKISDSRLSVLWRKAVLAYWKCDPMTGECDPSNLEAHHIIKRKHYITRWDWRNGIALSKETHRWLHEHPLEALEWLMDVTPFWDYLKERENWLKPDYLQRESLTDNEFRELMREDLLTCIKNHTGG